MLKCKICNKTFKNNYLGGLRDTINWGQDDIICGKCYNEGKENDN